MQLLLHADIHRQLPPSPWSGLHLPWDVQQLLTPLQAFLCSLGFAWASAPNENLLGLQGFRGFPYTVKIKGEVKDAAEAQVRTGTRSGSGHWPPWFWALNHSVCL